MTISKQNLLHHLCAMIKIQQDNLHKLAGYRTKDAMGVETARLAQLEGMHDQLLADAMSAPASSPALLTELPGLQTALASSTMPEDLLSCIRCAIAEKVELINTCKDEGTLEYLRGALIDLIQLELDSLRKASVTTTNLSIDVDTSNLESAMDDIASGLDKLRNYPAGAR